MMPAKRPRRDVPHGPERADAGARLDDALEALVRSAGADVTLDLSLEDGVIVLDLLIVEPSVRGRGLGRRIMEDLLAVADKHRIAVGLHAMSLRRDELGPDLAELEAWYERLGFVRTGRVSVMGLAEMRRPPSPPCVPGSPDRQQRTSLCVFVDASRR